MGACFRHVIVSVNTPRDSPERSSLRFKTEAVDEFNVLHILVRGLRFASDGNGSVEPTPPGLGMHYPRARRGPFGRSSR
jgi:hypothetical protein